MNPAERIADNLKTVRQRIDEAAVRSGRSSADVQLITVSKYVDATIAQLLVNAGCHHLGESRPQQLWEKAAALDTSDVRWHLICHLQRNKIRRTLPHTSLIHSVDSCATLTAVDRVAGELGVQSQVLIEVNVSGDDEKHGVISDKVEPILSAAASLDSVHVRGLMTMAALGRDLDVARRNFATLRRLRDQLASICPDNVSLDELSMGMSGDFDVAIEEGATLVRVGSALYEGLA